MRRFLTLTATELEMTLSKRARKISVSLIIFALLLPLVFSVVGRGSKFEVNPVSIAIVDSSGEDLLEQIRDELSKIDLIKTVYHVSLEEAKELLDSDLITLYLLFPPTFFEDSFAARPRDPIEIHLNPLRAVESEYFSRFADEVSLAISELSGSYFAYVDLVRPLYPSEFLFKRKMDMTVAEIFMRVLQRNRNVISMSMPRFDMFSHLITSGLITFTLFFSLLPLSYSRRDKESGLERRLTSLGLPLAARRLSRLIAALPWYLVTLTSVSLVMRLGYLVMISPLSFLSLIALWLVFGLLFEVFGRRFNRGSTASLAAIAVVFVALLTGGILYPRSLLPKAAASFGSILPSGLVQNAVFEQLKTSSDVKMPLVWIGLFLTASAVIAADYLADRRGTT